MENSTIDLKIDAIETICKIKIDRQIQLNKYIQYKNVLKDTFRQIQINSQINRLTDRQVKQKNVEKYMVKHIQIDIRQIDTLTDKQIDIYPTD